MATIAQNMTQYCKPKNCKGFTVEQHKHFGFYVRHRRHEALDLSVLLSWAYGKTSKVHKLAEKLEAAVSNLNFHMDDAVCHEDSQFLKTLSRAEIEVWIQEFAPTDCYYGGSEEEYQRWNDEFDSGLREIYQHIPGSSSYYCQELRRGKHRQLTLEEHRHIARIVRCQIRQSVIATNVVWKAYGTYAPVTKAAFNWWKAANKLFWALNELSGEMNNLYYIEMPECEKSWYLDEVAADQLPLVEPLLEFYPKEKGYDPNRDGCGVNISYP